MALIFLGFLKSIMWNSFFSDTSHLVSLVLVALGEMSYNTDIWIFLGFLSNCCTLPQTGHCTAFPVQMLHKIVPSFNIINLKDIESETVCDVQTIIIESVFSACNKVKRLERKRRKHLKNGSIRCWEAEHATVVSNEEEKSWWLWSSSLYVPCQMTCRATVVLVLVDLTGGPEDEKCSLWHLSFPFKVTQSILPQL